MQATFNKDGELKVGSRGSPVFSFNGGGLADVDMCISYRTLARVPRQMLLRD